MNKLYFLIRTNFKVFLGAMKTKKKGRYVFSTAMLVIAFIFLGITFGGQSFLQASMFKDSGFPEMAIFTSLITALSLSALVSLMRASTAATSNDAELLLSLPVSRRMVVVSKIVSQYIFDAPLVFVIFGSSVVAHTAFGGGIPSLLRGLILMLLLPLLPITLSYLLGSFIAAMQERFRMAKLFTSGFLMLLLVGYMFLNFSSSSFYSQLEDLGRDKAIAIIDAIAPLSWLTHFVTDGSLLPSIFSVLLLVVPFYIAIQIFSIFFGRPKTGFRSKSKIVDFPVKSPRMALYEKEVKRYLNMPLYVFNTAFGPLLMLILTGVVGVMGIDKLMESMEIDLSSMAMVPPWLPSVIITGLLCFTLSVTSTTCASISLEGKQLWILKVNPIKTEDIFFSKCLLNVVLTVPVAVLSAVITGIRLGQNFFEILLHCLVLTVLGVTISLLGLMVNLLFPRFDWENEAQIIKQSMSVMMNMLFAFILTVLPFPFVFLLTGFLGIAGFYIGQIIIYGVALGVIVLLLKTSGRKMFESFAC